MFTWEEFIVNLVRVFAHNLYFFRSQIPQDGGQASYVAAKDCFPVTTLKRFNRNEYNEEWLVAFFFFNGYVNILARFKDYSFFN